MTKLLLYGLQRSGTNFLEQIVSKNFDVAFLNSNEHRDAPIQKHFRLYDDKDLITPPAYRNDMTFKDFAAFEEVLPESADGYLVISKDPYSWTLSYQAWAKKCNWAPVDFHPAAEWEAFYAKWLAFAAENAKVMTVRYVDLLDDAEGVLKAISERFGLARKNEDGEVTGALERVPQSGTFTDDRKRYYMDREYLQKLSGDDIAEINKQVTASTLEGLSYERLFAQADSDLSV